MAKFLLVKVLVIGQTSGASLQPHSAPVVVLGGYIWFLRTTPFQNSKIFFIALWLLKKVQIASG